MKGFTLIEILVTIAIIAILSSLAIPSYVGYIERSKLISGTEGLSSLRGLMEQHYQRERDYRIANGDCGIPNSSNEYFSNACTATKTTFTWTATSLAGKGLGSAGDFVYKIDQSGTQTTSKFAGSTPTVTAGWKIRK